MLRNRHVLLSLLAACLTIACVAVAYPMYVIRPFRAQGATELATALEVRRWGPAVTMVAAAIAAVSGVLLWRTARSLATRIAAVSMAVITAALAAAIHVNIFELMFHRVNSPQAIAASEATMETNDMVLAISAGGESRAYPVRMMGYHHIVNDVVGGKAIVATY